VITRVHLVYPHGDAISTPDAIGREVGRRLAERFEVIYHDWSGFERIRPDRDAALVGHAHPVPGTTFRRSLAQEGWGRTVMFQPFTTTVGQVGFLATLVPKVDVVLAICGRHWSRQLGSSFFASWQEKFRQVDLAVEGAHFPPVIEQTRPPGERRFLYIGRDVPMKNVGYLSALAQRRPEWRFSWAGVARRSYPGLHELGVVDFQSPAGKAVVADHDFFVTVGNADANPTTVIEAMAWGLVPVCTPQSGYEDYPGITNVPLDDPPAAVDVLDRLQHLPSAEIDRIRAANWQRVAEYYTWDRVAAQVRDALTEPDLPPPGRHAGVRELAVALRWVATAPNPSNRAGIMSALKAGGRRQVRRLLRRPSGG
jgi:glycosyltransferase involved in cell wall biosynthesis